MSIQPGRLVARLGLWLAALALLGQSLAFATPPMPRDARAAAAQLSALLGPGVVVCAQADEPGAPPPPDCRDSCPICQALGAAAAFDPPRLTSLPAPAFVLADILTVVLDTPAPPAPPGRFALARGPPSLA